MYDFRIKEKTTHQICVRSMIAHTNDTKNFGIQTSREKLEKAITDFVNNVENILQENIVFMGVPIKKKTHIIIILPRNKENERSKTYGIIRETYDSNEIATALCKYLCAGVCKWEEKIED